MGLAIFWIFFYHTGIEFPGLRELFALGWMGVDIFFFVSGYGLCASLTKHDSIKNFYGRRFKRIIPTWWLILATMAVIGTTASLKGFPTTWTDLFYWFTGLGWWTDNCYFEWYIPTLLAFYLLAPLLAKQTIQTLIIAIIAAIIAAITLGGGNCPALDHIYMSYSRIPIYIFGFLLYKVKAHHTNIKVNHWLPFCIIGLIWFAIGMYIKNFHIAFGLTIARTAIPLFIVPMLSITGWLIGKCRPIETILTFMGLISLEMYLLHINHEFSKAIESSILSGVHSDFIKIVWFALVLSGAWILHHTINWVTQIRKTPN